MAAGNPPYSSDVVQTTVRLPVEVRDWIAAEGREQQRSYEGQARFLLIGLWKESQTTDAAAS
jgi:hypothetical protein